MGKVARLLAAATLLAVLACGGGRGGGSGTAAGQTASALVYTDPTDTTQWRLVKNGTSTPTHLVLDLLAPAGTSGMGVTLVLTVDGTRAGWADAGQGALVKPGSYQGTLAQRASLQGSALRILLSQVNPAPPIPYGTAPLLTVALALNAGAATGPVACTATEGGHLAAPLTLPVPVAISLGALEAQ